MSMLIDSHRFGGGGGDPYYSNVVMLLHGDGANASTTFTDSSPTPYNPDNKAGDVQISTAQSVYGGASIKFDGTGDYLYYSSSTGRFQFGSGDFTVEARIRLGATGADRGIADFRSAWGAEGWSLLVSASNKLTFFAGDSSLSAWEVTLESSALSANVWYAAAVSRVGNTFRLFLDGSVVASATWAGAIGYTTGAPLLCVGAFFSVAYGPFNGYLDEVRITKGVGRYSGTYTPAAEAFPNS